MNRRKRIRLLLIFAFIFHSSFCYPFHNKIISNAIAELGNGEIGGNNKGKYIQQYNKGLEAAWCAGFVSYIINKSGITELGYSLSAKQLFNKAKTLNWITNKPQPGDIIVFWRDNPKSWKGHTGIVEKVEENKIITIEGNVGKFPAKVKRFTYNRKNIPKLLGYIRIPK